MRLALVAVALLLVAAPALGATPDLGRLVLRASDVPTGFVVVPDETGPRSNRQEWRDEPQAREILRKAGRVTGYESRFERGLDSIASRVDLFAVRPVRACSSTTSTARCGSRESAASIGRD